MKNVNGSIHLQSGGRESRYKVLEATVVTKVGGELKEVTGVSAELVIDHKVLRRLIEKAFRNKSKRSSDGPLTVRITG
jgi:hypothetical protein